MSSEWRVAKVEDIAAPFSTALATGPFGSAISSKYFVASGVPVIRGSNLSADISTRLIDADLVFISQDKANEFQRSVAKRGDLVFTCWGTINQVGLIDGRSKFDSYIVSNKQMKLTIDPAKADHRFIYYVFSGPAKQNEILENGIGSSVPGFNLGQLKRHEVLLPPVQEQRQIADFLETLDDRITLLRETNATLEAIAQALFKSWFVDFDPVRAKAEGRQPEGMDATTAALFPDSFEESELGLVPSGWAVGVLGDIASIKGGKQLEKEFFDDRGLNPIFGGAGVMGHTDLKNAQGFVITVGRVGAYCGQFFWHLGEAWVNNNASHIQPMRNLDAVWIYQWLRATNIDHIKKGAAQPFVSNGDLAELKLALPTGELVDRFVEVVGPVYEQMASLQAQAKTLTQLRDTLLPRLISGQLRLPEAETLLEKAL